MNAPARIPKGPTYFPDMIQGSEEWLKARCGLLTASEMRLIVSPPPKPETRVKKNGEPYKQREWNPAADNEICRAHLWELLNQRLTDYVAPSYISDAMLRGQDDEIYAREAYSQHFAEVSNIGFITNDRWGFTIGYSPDGAVRDDGLIECKSRAGKYQVQTIVENAVPDEFMIQLQAGLLVSGRKWVDFVSYSGGLPLFVKRVMPNPLIQCAIITAAAAFEANLAAAAAKYHENLSTMPKVIETERREDLEIIL